MSALRLPEPKINDARGGGEAKVRVRPTIDASCELVVEAGDGSHLSEEPLFG